MDRQDAGWEYFTGLRLDNGRTKPAGAATDAISSKQAAISIRVKPSLR